MRLKVMAALVAVMSGMLMLLTATPSSAASFGFRTAWNPSSDHNGAAILSNGRIDYFGRYAADVKTWIKDACPADGYGAYARLEVTSTHGSVGYSDWIWKHREGCGDTAVYSYDAFYWHFDIRHIRVHLCEIDYSGSTPRRGDCAYSARKDNPHT